VASYDAASTIIRRALPVGKVTFPIALMAIGFSTVFGWAGACKHSTDTIAFSDYPRDDINTSVAAFYNGVHPVTGAAYETCTGTDGNKAKAAFDNFAFKAGAYTRPLFSST